MPADVFDFYLHAAYCPDCDWEGTLTENHETCTAEAENHNDLSHRQGVER